MKLQIKSLSGELDENQKQYLRKKFLWLEERLPNSAVLTVGVREHITKKSNQAFELVVHLVAPKIKKPIYVKLFKNTFTQAVDTAKDKIERIVVKRKEQGSGMKFRVPRIKFNLPFRKKLLEEDEKNTR